MSLDRWWPAIDLVPKKLSLFGSGQVALAKIHVGDVLFQLKSIYIYIVQIKVFFSNQTKHQETILYYIFIFLEHR